MCTREYQTYRVVSTVESAVSRTSNVVGAERSVPSVASVAVGGAASVMSPAPVGVKNDLSSLGRASTASGTFVPGKSGVDFSGVGADLLGRDGDSTGEGEEGSRLEHVFIKYVREGCFE